jgi:hypothetical protein
MAREIKFRAKRIDNGEWVYGLPVYGNLDITPTEMQDVNDSGRLVAIRPETITQYIGNTETVDRPGVDIYDGDIVEWDGDENIDVKAGRGVVEWMKHHVAYRIRHDHAPGLHRLRPIGNIHDNPELLPSKS